MSCPNIVGEPQLGYDMERLEIFMQEVFKVSGNLKVGLKLPPYFDESHIFQVAKIILKYPVRFITCINSLGCGLILGDDMLPVIAPNDGLGGIGGDYCKPIGLSNVYQFHKKLGTKIEIIRCGGIKTGKDVAEYLKCGATMVQVGTQLVKEGVKCFDRLNDELRIHNKFKNSL